VRIGVALNAEGNVPLAQAGTVFVPLATYYGRAQFEQGMKARQDGDFPRAVQEFSRAIESMPSASSFYYWRADSYVRMAQFDDAIRDFDRALALQPTDRKSRVGRAAALVWKGDLEAAVRDFTLAINDGGPTDSWTAWAFRGRGLALAALDRPDEAVLDYRTYLILAPTATDRDEVESWIAALQR
jgi:tetratricopeptide (TPR) repeat protein